MNDYNHLHRWLPPLIDKTGLSYENFARKARISRNMIYKYLNDSCRPTSRTMARICRVLQVPLQEGLSQYADRNPGPRPSMVARRQARMNYLRERSRDQG